MPDQEIIIRDGDVYEVAQLIPDQINITVVDEGTTQHLYESLKSILQAGDNVTITANDTAQSFTFASAGGGSIEGRVVRSISSSIHDQEIVFVITYTDNTTTTQRVELPQQTRSPYRISAYRSFSESDPDPQPLAWTSTTPPSGWSLTLPSDVNTSGRKVFESRTTYNPADQTFSEAALPIRLSPYPAPASSKEVTAVHLNVSGQELTTQINFSDNTNVSDSVTLPGGGAPPPTPRNIEIYYGAVPIADPISETGLSHETLNIAVSHTSTVSINFSSGDEIRFLLPHDHPLISLRTTTLDTSSLNQFTHTENALTINNVSYDSYKRGVDFVSAGSISYILGVRN